jgi:protocatechuate 3,4-dioxygenase beta subunit
MMRSSASIRRLAIRERVPFMSTAPHDHGLGHDLTALNAALLKRRRALVWLASAGALPLALPLAGCGGSSDATSTTSDTATSTTSTTTTTTTTTTGSCSVIPTETNGPYPADGTTALNALLLSGIVRSDVRSSFAGATATAVGIPMTITLNLVNTNSSCASLAGYAVYIWHCSATGLYSLYSAGVTGENFLRGVQAADSNGLVTFTTIVPGCYVGRWPHIHVEVYPSLASATSVSKVSKITQIAIPAATCSEVYATSTYGSSASNLSQITLATDNVFSDGATLETPSITGSVSDGYALALTVGIAA